MNQRTRLSTIRFKLGAMRLRYSYVIAIISCCICLLFRPTVAPVIANPDWVIESNKSAELLTTAIAAKSCQPKFANSDLRETNANFKTCRQEKIFKEVQRLEKKLTQAKNSDLSLDLEILLKVGRQSLRSYQLDEKYRLPYVNLSQAILEDLKSAAKESKSSAKQQAILTKLKQYAGLQPGTTALAESLIQSIQTKLQQSEVVLPRKEQLKKELNNNASRIHQIKAFLEQQNVTGYEPAYAQLKAQLFDYETFIRREVVTKTKQNLTLPQELYIFNLQEQGIEIPVEELMQQAHNAFFQVQQQMSALAPKIAQKKGLKVTDYRDVIQLLQQEQLSAQDTLHLYRQRAQELETIIQREHLVTLPEAEFHIRLATAQENKNFPVPLYDASSSTFVIPVLQNQPKARLYNDFTNPAMSWTLTVHEGRPGHDLQHAITKTQNLSRARTDFAVNATNIEGWATYAEELMRPYLPLEGQFMSLQFQLLRAARAFLEPELQLGKITIAEALEVLTQNAGFSQFFAEQEIQRYIARFPGQAPAYFYGYQQFLQLRSRAKKMLGKQYSVQKFNDFVLSQGFLTPKLLNQVLKSQI
ncbi:MAG: DUF885 domain-containing protein [Cyanobacteria bacterium P01_G01_bin.39]